MSGVFFETQCTLQTLATAKIITKADKLIVCLNQPQLINEKVL